MIKKTNSQEKYEVQSGKFVYGFVCGKGYLINNFDETNDPNFKWLAIRAIYWI